MGGNIRQEDFARHAGANQEHGPHGYQRSDERTRKAANNQLAADLNLNASDIMVRVDKSVVTLSGSVDSHWEKRRAEDLAKSVAGVMRVNNNLRVSMATQTTPIQT